MERQSDSRRFRTLVEMLGVTFRTEMSTPLFEAYWCALEDQHLADVEWAVQTIIREGEDYMPPPGRVRALARMHSRQLKMFPTPEEARAQAQLEAAEAQRIADTWKGHENELAEMKAQTRALAETKS